MYIETAVKDLKEGDLVDLEGDIYADPDHDKPLLVDTYQEVDRLEPEGEGCICVYFVDFTCAFPPEHRVRVHRD